MEAERIDVRVAALTADFFREVNTAVDQGTKTLGKGFDDAAKKGQGFASNVNNQTNSIAKGFGALAVAAGGALATFVSFQQLKGAISTTQKLAGEVGKLARETGLTAEESSRLIFAFKRVGLGADQAGSALRILFKRLQGVADEESGLVKGGKSAAAILKDMGIEALDAAGNMKPISKLLPEIADQFKELPDGIEKTARAQALFGRSGADLIPLLNLGSEGLEEMGRMADKLGVTLSAKNLADVKKYTVAQRDLSEALGGIKLAIGLAVMPALTTLLRFFVDAQPTVRGFVNEGINYVKDGIGTLRDVMEDISRSSVFRAFLDGIKEGLENVKNVATDTKDAIVDAFAKIDGVLASVPGLSKFTDSMTEMGKPENQEGVKDVGKLFAEAAAGIIAFSVSVTLLDTSINIIGNTLGGLGALVMGLAVLPNPFILALVAVAAFIGGLVLLEKETGFLSEKVLPVLKDIAKETDALIVLGVTIGVGLVGAFLAWSVAASAAASATAAAAGVTTVALSPFLLLAAAVVGVGIAFAIIEKETGFFSQKLIPALEKFGKLELLPALKELAETVKTEVIPAVEKFGKTEAIPRLQKFGDWLKTKFIPWVREVAKDFEDDWLPIIKEIGMAVGTFLLPALDTLRDLLVDAIIPALEFLAKVVAPVVEWFEKHKTASELLVAVLAGLAIGILILLNPWLLLVAAGLVLLAQWDTLSKRGMDIVNLFKGIIETVLELPVIGEIFQTVFSGIWIIVRTYFELIRNIVETGMLVMKDIIGIVLALIDGDFGRVWQGIKDLVGHLVQGMVDQVGIILGGLKDLVWNALQGILAVASDLGGQIGIAIGAGFGLAKSGAVSVLNWIIDRINEFTGRIGSVLGALGGLLGKVGIDVPEIPKIGHVGGGQEASGGRRYGGAGLEYEHGGVVPGPRGKPQLATVHGGELIVAVGSTLMRVLKAIGDFAPSVARGIEAFTGGIPAPQALTPSFQGQMISANARMPTMATDGANHTDNSRRMTNYGKVIQIFGPGRNSRDVLLDVDRMVR